MKAHLHWLTRWRIRRLFTVGLEPAGYRALLTTLRHCPSCAACYRRHHTLEAALCERVPSPFAVERMEQLVLDSTAVREPGGHGVWIWATAALAVLALVLLLSPRAPERVLLADNTRLGDLTVVARGGTPGVSDVGIRLFRVVGDGVAPAGNLTPKDVVTFSYSNLRPGVGHLALVGIQEDGVVWYYPDQTLRGGVVDEPLGDGFRPKHRPGWLRVTALFSKAPLDRRTVERAIARVRALDPLEPLPLGDAVEHSLLIRVEP